jgi:hypothetical protein
MDLEPGQVERVKRRVLIDQLGPRLAAELGLDAETDDKRGRRPSTAGRRPASESDRA